MTGPGPVVPMSFDLSSMIQRSVASLYSHLVTRPTGRALRLGIETQIGDIGSVCLSVLDFAQVVVLDYSCADEVVAKLVQRYQHDDRPADAYFIARGLAEQHRDPIDDVLVRHQLALVAEVDGEFVLLGAADAAERAAWSTLQRLRLGEHGSIARALGGDGGDVAAALDRLAVRRAVFRRDSPLTYFSLTTMLPGPDSQGR